jgi:nucleolar complex protein 2
LSTSAGFAEVREEAVYVMAEWLASVAASREHGGTMSALAFPELIIPVVGGLRKALKAPSAQQGKGGKKGKGKKGGPSIIAGDGAGGGVKVLIERVEETATVISRARDKRGIKDAKQGPALLGLTDIGETPLEKYVKILKKTREKKKAVMEGVRKGQMEVKDGDSDVEMNMEDDMDSDDFDSEDGEPGDVDMMSDDE